MKKSFKRSTVILLTVLMVAALSVTVFAAGRWVQAWQDDTLKIKFNGVTQTFTDPDDGSQIVPLVYNGRTYLPVRAIATLAGLGVDYDDASHSVLLTSSGAAPANDNTQGDKPYKDSQSFNDAAANTSDNANVSKANIAPGTYENLEPSKTRHLLKDDFKSLTQYGFDVSESLADDGEKITFQMEQISPNSTSYGYPNFTVQDRENIVAKLYTNIVNAAKSNGWAIKDQGNSTTDFEGKTYPKVYLYKDGLYLQIDSFIDNLKITAYTWDTGLH